MTPTDQLNELAFAARECFEKSDLLRFDRESVFAADRLGKLLDFLKDETETNERSVA